MPKHNHKCKGCKLIFERSTAEPQKCPTCGCDAVWLPEVMVGVSMRGWHPNLGHEPVYIDSLKDLDRELSERNLHLPEGRRKDKNLKLPASYEEAKEKF